MRTIFFILIPLLLISALADTHAGIYGVLTGKITDHAGNPLLGATILVEGTSRGALSKINGSYTVLKIPAGTHTVRIKSVGYVSTTHTVTMVADSTTTLPTIALNTDITTSVDTTRNRPQGLSSELLHSIPVEIVQSVISRQGCPYIPRPIEDKSHVRSLSLPGRETTIENAGMAVPGVFIAP